MTADRLLVDAPGTIAVTFLNGETPTDSSTQVTVTVTRDSDGATVVNAANATKPAGTTGRYEFTLSQVQLPDLDELTAVWTGNVGGAVTITTKVEVVGGFYVSLQALRAMPNLGDQAKFTTAELREARTWFETTFEDYTGVAWVPRYRRQRLSGTGLATLQLPTPAPRSIRSVRVYTGPATYTSFTADELAGISFDGMGLLQRWSGLFARGSRNVDVAYEHGLDSPPPDVVQAAKVAIRDHLIGANAGNRQYSVATEAGVVRSSQPGVERPFGIPDVDAVANRRRLDTGAGSVVIG